MHFGAVSATLSCVRKSRVKECVIDMLSELTAMCDVPMSQCFKVVQAVLKAADVKLLDTIESTSATTRAVLERALIEEYHLADQMGGVKEFGLNNDGTSFWSIMCALFVRYLFRLTLSLSQRCICVMTIMCSRCTTLLFAVTL
jgi:hypothetical protein